MLLWYAHTRAHTNMYTWYTQWKHSYTKAKRIKTRTTLVMLWERESDFCYFVTRRGQSSLYSTLSVLPQSNSGTHWALRICAPHFSPNVRINYELINITLRSSHFYISPLPLRFCVVRNNGSEREPGERQRGGMELWMHYVLTSATISGLWIRGCV